MPAANRRRRNPSPVRDLPIRDHGCSPPLSGTNKSRSLQAYSAATVGEPVTEPFPGVSGWQLG
jgi:hypothetical protein